MKKQPLVSIGIPTYNRHHHLKRILSYYADYKIPYKIIVADSSSKAIKKINRKTISSLANLDIQYVDDYFSKINPLRKVNDALKNVNTKYCVLCADDDFVTPNGINQSVDFLEKNPDFTVAHGQYICFSLKNNKKGKQRFYWRSIYPYKSIISPDAKFRLHFHFSNYYPTVYAIHRTDFLKMIFKEALRFTNDGRFGELLPSMTTLIYGKMKRLDILYQARETIPGSLGRTSKSLKDFIKNGTYKTKYAKFRGCLVRHLRKNSYLSLKEARKVVNKAMAVYIKKRHSDDTLRNVLTKKLRKYQYVLKKRIIKKGSAFLDSLPKKMRKRIRFFKERSVNDFIVKYRRLFPSEKKRTPIDLPKPLPSKYQPDLKKIQRHVLLYQKKIYQKKEQNNEKD